MATSSLEAADVCLNHQHISPTASVVQNAAETENVLVEWEATDE
jgi:hypothetical protein